MQNCTKQSSLHLDYVAILYCIILYWHGSTIKKDIRNECRCFTIRII